MSERGAWRRSPRRISLHLRHPGRLRTVCGKEALTAAASLVPDIIFVDILLPGLNGYDVAIALRKMPELNRPYLVALTGWTGDERRVRSRAAGFDEHITKPIHYATIQRLITLAKS